MTRAALELGRFLRPSSVAVVGASERQQRSNNAIGTMMDAGMKLYFVNPNRPEAYGMSTYASIGDIPIPVDAVLSLVGAEAAIGVVTEAASAGAGGVAVIAGGFAESGAEGVELQHRLLEAAGVMPVLGPNCNGFVRPSIGARLSGTPRWPFPGGFIGVVTHSGAMLGPVGIAAAERAVGVSSFISTGNEMLIDMADCIDFLAEDDETTCIALLVETIRSPERFFRAVDHATARNKPIVVVKLGRSARGSEIASSHTGALAGEAWVYDMAFRQHGMTVASDVIDLLDRVTLCAQIPSARWSAMNGVAIATLSGGFSALASDVCAQEGIELPALSEVSDAINAIIPGRTTINPLDMTGFAMGRNEVVRGIVGTLARADHIDAVLLHWPLIDEGEESAESFAAAAVEASSAGGKPVVLWSIDDGRVGSWAAGLISQGVGVSRGLRATIRGLRTMGDFVAYRIARAKMSAPESVAVIARPVAKVVHTPAGPMLPFETVMSLLTDSGIPVAAFTIIEEGATVPSELRFSAPYVVKLADVPHRTDIGAVRFGVSPADLAEAVAAMRALAIENGSPGRVVVQRQVVVEGEAFLGIKSKSDLGPLVLFGVGGVFIEILGRVAGGLAPLDSADAHLILGSMDDTGVFDGARGKRRWDRNELESLLIATGRLAAASDEWMVSLDVNPLALTTEGFVALDGLCFVRED
ncbi:unannotated protein [freshwater metagenome]|uniref:Unannotated protein n=1 Tax=freshwater metagenome TaxID=449393 RepID=A0A6J7GLK0_9ZZZZ|nr:CoA-binding protein [Actinomycetota bacterium]